MSAEGALTCSPPASLPYKDAQSHSQPDSIDNHSINHTTSTRKARWRVLYNRLGYVPQWCRYDPNKPFEFSMTLNILFGRCTNQFKKSICSLSLQPLQDASRSRISITVTLFSTSWQPTSTSPMNNPRTFLHWRRQAMRQACCSCALLGTW